MYIILVKSYTNKDLTLNSLLHNIMRIFLNNYYYSLNLKFNQ